MRTETFHLNHFSRSDCIAADSEEYIATDRLSNHNGLSLLSAALFELINALLKVIKLTVNYVVKLLTP